VYPARNPQQPAPEPATVRQMRQRLARETAAKVAAEGAAAHAEACAEKLAAALAEEAGKRRCVCKRAAKVAQPDEGEGRTGEGDS